MGTLGHREWLKIETVGTQTKLLWLTHTQFFLPQAPAWSGLGLDATKYPKGVSSRELISTRLVRPKDELWPLNKIQFWLVRFNFVVNSILAGKIQFWLVKFNQCKSRLPDETWLTKLSSSQNIVVVSDLRIRNEHPRPNRTIFFNETNSTMGGRVLGLSNAESKFPNSSVFLRMWKFGDIL